LIQFSAIKTFKEILSVIGGEFTMHKIPWGTLGGKKKKLALGGIWFFQIAGYHLKLFPF
jgi:hypothetical protein